MASAAAVLLALNEASPVQLVAALALLLAGSVLLASVLSRTVLKPRKSPPIVACMPLLGGFAKFIKARTRARASPACKLACADCEVWHGAPVACRPSPALPR